MLSLLPLREKVDSASFLRETDEGLVDASSISSSPLIRRFTPPSPSRGEGKETSYNPSLALPSKTFPAVSPPHHKPASVQPDIQSENAAIAFPCTRRLIFHI